MIITLKENATPEKVQELAPKIRGPRDYVTSKPRRQLLINRSHRRYLTRRQTPN